MDDLRCKTYPPGLFSDKNPFEGVKRGIEGTGPCIPNGDGIEGWDD